MMQKQARMVSRAVAGLVLATATAAHAEVIVYDKDGWTLSLDGRINAYYSYEWGDYKPHFTAEQIAENGGVAPTANSLVWSEFTAISAQDPMQCNAAGVQMNGAACTFSTSRVHSGFVGNLVGFTTKKKISDNLKATARVSLWWPIETDQYRGYSSMHPDPRESYVKLEGPWGGVLAGRALGLHDRGGTTIDFLYANGHSVGSPCSATGQGPLCGYIGYGYQFPSFNAGIIYNTPEASGFELAAGIYDPVRTGQQTVILETTPYPRVESEASYTYKGSAAFFTLFVNGMWQQARGFHTDAGGLQAAISRNALGASAGGRVEVGGVKLGVVANWDVGGGDQSGLVGPVPVDNDGNLRTVKGAMGQLMYSLAKLDIAAGAGLTRVEQTPFDVSHHDDVIKTRLGASGTVTYHLDPSISLSAQYFHAEHTFWMGQIQRVNFVNTGLDFVW
jgi:predicted porin